MAKMNKVALIHYVLAHYREPIFGLLCRQKEMEFTFFSDPVNRYSSVRSIEPSKASIPVEQGGLRWRFLKNHFFGNWLWQSGVVRLSLSKEFDTIIYEGSAYVLSAWVGAALARLTGKRVLMWGHGFLEDEKGVKGWVRKTFYRLAHGMLVYHNRSREILIKKGFHPDNLYVVYNSLDYDAQVEIRKQIKPEDMAVCRKQLFSNPNVPILLFIGRLIPSKKLNMMIEAAKLLNDKGLLCNILIVGDGPETEKLQKLAQKHELESNIHFYGPCYDEKQIALLTSASDICVSPGEVGLTCMHSLVYGTPVITHDDPDAQGPEYEAIRPGYNGAFFKKDDIEDLAAIIDRWLQDNKEHEAVSSHCHEVIDKYYNPHYQVKVVSAAVLNQKVK